MARGENINIWVSNCLQCNKALKALAEAKALEVIQIKNGKTYKKVNKKTKVLR